MMNKNIQFNRVEGLKFLYFNFPNLFNENRIKLYFVDSKKELFDLQIENRPFDKIILKRSANKSFISDIQFKDNRFFKNLEELKKGSLEFEDIFAFCVECHKFKQGEDYFSDKLAIAQFSTKPFTDSCDRINFIPSKVPGVNTRDNEPYFEVEFHYNYSNIFHIISKNENLIKANGFNEYTLSYLIAKIHKIIEELREFLIEQNYFNNFQLIIRIDSYLNLLPIDFRSPEAWTKIHN